MNDYTTTESIIEAATKNEGKGMSLVMRNGQRNTGHVGHSCSVCLIFRSAATNKLMCATWSEIKTLTIYED